MAPTLAFSRPDADIYVPAGSKRVGDNALHPAGDAAAALARTTHQDDIEIMAHSGIAECWDSSQKFFTGVVATNGAGSPRTGQYAAYTDEQMQAVRRKEQRTAADIGRYNLQLQLAHPSAAVKTPRQPEVLADLTRIFGSCRAEIVYLHNPADKHDTHVALLLRCLEALRSLPADRRPLRVVGCEVWRDLDWLVDGDKVALDAGQRPELALPLLEVFDSQVTGGKRYDLAAVGRRSANATFHTSHQTDRMSAIVWAMDLTPLVAQPDLSIRSYVAGYVERLRQDVDGRLNRFGGT
jgi:LmbE family N-acetylglucosaminyl deacetylase